MKKNQMLLFVSVLLFFFTSCTVLESGPEKIYYEFEEFCANGDQSSAKLLVSQQGIDENQEFGVCILAPNQFGRLFQTDIFSLEDPEPDVEINGDIALLTWWSSDHKIVMTMYKIDGIWKIRTTTIYPQ